MNRLSRRTLGLVATGLVALSLSAGAIAEDKTLYQRLGGKPALEAVVGELWAITSADERINHYFANTKPEAFAGQLVDFLCQAAGGPCQYEGKDMQAAHTGMSLTDADFAALAENVEMALDKFDVPAKEHGEVMAMLGSLKSAVVNH
ncbi:MAG: group 1 truncated hemoglobin [Rhodocyclaceae bacterium]|nr:group 1 truncated hemoglobin [Rhodocyclaceae bacterium]